MTKSLWREISPQEKQQIKQEAKSLLNNFASKINKIKTHPNHTKNNSGSRQEGTGWTTDPEFHDTSFANAPLTKNNFIIAERGKWT
jgi:hypothetical protein